tara:strand:- start:266 stop:541 length:276 start_codon:yes stop_codon:yes gene_type:complete
MITEKQKQVFKMQDETTELEQELFRTEKSLSYAEVAHIVQYVFHMLPNQIRKDIEHLEDFREKKPDDSCSWTNCLNEARNILHCIDESINI